MEIALLIVHLVIAIALVGVILVQRSEGGALGIGGGPGGLMSARGAANFLTRATTWLAVAFLATSLSLAILGGGEQGGDSVLDVVDEEQAPDGPEVPVPD